MKKRYTGAMAGQGGILSSIAKAWASRFHSINAFIMIPDQCEKITLNIKHSTLADADIVTLTRRNWRTGAETILYTGRIDTGTPRRTRTLKD